MLTMMEFEGTGADVRFQGIDGKGEVRERNGHGILQSLGVKFCESLACSTISATDHGPHELNQGKHPGHPCKGKLLLM
jgi:hypothetical protein